VQTLYSQNIIFPEVGRRSPQCILIVVDLSALFGPKNPKPLY